VSALPACDVCGNDKLINSINLGSHPLQDDLVPVGDDRECVRYPTEVVFCDVCKTAHMKYQLPKKTLFQPSYSHRSSQTHDVLLGMADLVASYEKRYGSLERKVVWDIGCNDGSLLDEFQLRGARTYGCEPTDAADAAAKKHGVAKRFFDPIVAHDMLEFAGRPDVMTFTNVFAHIEDVKFLCRAVRIANPKVLIIENHYLGSVIEKNQFDTFFHEHLRTYSYTSFLHIAKELGMYIDSVSFPPRYGGNIRVYMTPVMPGQKQLSFDHKKYIESEHDFSFGLHRLHQRVGWWKKAKRKQIFELTDVSGVGCAPIEAIALPARAPMLFTLLGLDRNRIKTVWQIPGSAKIGHYVPGTRIPICSDQDYKFDKSLVSDVMLNMAWHIAPEIETRWRRLGYEGDFLNVIDPKDFDPDA
jgi:hypothetical protein